jgi:ribosome biogenesis GTPase
LPNGGLLIDTPGIRELSIWGTEDNLEHIYQDIITLSARCKYQDCHHDNESGCAIRKALQNGSLNKAHYANYQKMKHELTSLTNNRARRIKKDNKRPRAAISWDDED